MGIIMINCPATGRGVSTGIEVCATDQLPVVTATTICPACGRAHEWTKKEAWLGNGGEQYHETPEDECVQHTREWPAQQPSLRDDVHEEPTQS